MKKVSYFLWLLTISFISGAQTKPPVAKVIAGPMLGYAEHRECLVWIQTACNKSISIKYSEANSNTEGELTINNKNENTCQPWIAKFVLTDLKPNTIYNYQVLIDKKAITFPYPLSFKTKKLWAEWSKEDPYDVSFLVGSCNYVNDSAYDRPGKPYGQSTDIFLKMAETPSDFMLWLGDNTYTREADFSSASGLRYRYMHTRAEPNLQKFLSKQSNYAIWDDHDFGDNDANKSYDLKEVTKDCFANYWGNKTFGEYGRGVYHSLKYSDAEFFMLDDRTFRDESELDEEKYKNKTQLGETQISWLKNKLKHSASTFKFICVGGQFLNTETDKESFNLYKRERAEIIKFIAEQKISGVIFLTGDRHHTELLKYEPNSKPDYINTYPLFDLTSSALTAGPSSILKSKEADNPFRVPGTLLAENNYCGLKITGKRGERVVQITCYDKGGIVKWNFSISETLLKAK